MTSPPNNEMEIFSSVSISSLASKNRIMMPAITTGFADRDGRVTDKLLNFYRARARGGVGLIVLEATAVDPLGMGMRHELRIFDESCFSGLERVAEAVHEEGGKVLMQLNHRGRQTLSIVIKNQPVAPSPIPCLKFKEMPRELNTEEIQEIERAFIGGAQKARDLGYDGVELHAAHGYLLCQFLSPLSNIRTDEYGGETQNRTRIVVNIIEGIRKRVGSDFPVFVKISGDEYYPGGINLEEGLKIGKILSESGAWALTISAGNYGSFDWSIQPAEMEPGCLVHLAEAFKKEINVLPIIAVGRINEPSIAESVLREKKADLVAMGRALVADPYLLRKTKNGRTQEIDLCIADNACLKALFKKGRDMVCTVNKHLGTEEELHYQ